MSREKLTAQSYDAAASRQLEQARGQLRALEAPNHAPTVASVLEPLNDLWITIDAAMNQAGLFRNVHPDADIRKAASHWEQEFNKLVTDIGLSQPLFAALSKTDVSGEDAVTKRYVAHVLRDFRRAGVDRDEATRQKIRVLKEELVALGQSFETNIREDVRHISLDGPQDLAGLPQDYIDKHKPGADGKITITTEYPDTIAFMSYAHNDAARKALYTVFRQRGYPKNITVLNTILQKRFALAQLLNYPTWADYITEDKMIKTSAAAQTFIDKIAEVGKPRAKHDYQELLARLQKDAPEQTRVGDWQKGYLEELVKRESYRFDSQAARAFFPFAKVRQGLFDVTGKMFGVSYRKIDTPVWHPSVEAYEIRSGDEVLGRFYLDLHPRADKYQHAAAFPVRSGVAGRQLPEATLVCNFPEGDDALMEHDEVQTFFHEFGHLLHHLFAGKQRWVGVSGISTEWDFVEAPSQMLEEWTFDPTTLKSFAKNTKGEVIGDALIAAMRRAQDFGKGLQVTHQMFYAAVSLQFHRQDPKNLDTTALMQALQKRYSSFAYVPETYFQLSFGHLEGYSAIYYTYMWSLVIAKDLFSVFTENGLLNTEVAGHYRRSVLEPGGSKDAADLVHDFLGRDFSFDAFAKWLNSDT